ncbi:hypothetical protein [Mycolicibacterium fortuitum]|uniref:hypothetical protein n=1 Tax=Mycolicibacterium fortuitum TaxID=1766 RepID=UPI001041EA70|nr:hypothetical protein [Mycolicibacterium fortuitum]
MDRKLTAEVAEAERIPTGRFLSGGEIELLDSLAARLQQPSNGDHAEEYTDLLRRVCAIRTYSRTVVVSEPAPATRTEAATAVPPPRTSAPRRRRRPSPKKPAAKREEGDPYHADTRESRCCSSSIL